jgi:hypothetical protein
MIKDKKKNMINLMKNLSNIFLFQNFLPHFQQKTRQHKSTTFKLKSINY